VAKSPLGSEFDAFLFAPLGEDRNGLPLSVISLLARMNLDPWQEAGSLAALPAHAAATRLACSLDTLTDPELRQASSEVMVLRLLALLPRPVSAASRMAVPGAPAAPAANLGTRIGTIIFIVSVIILLGSQILAARRNAAIQPGITQAPAVLSSPSPAAPTDPGH
jgi:hypothetical protein